MRGKNTGTDESGRRRGAATERTRAKPSKRAGQGRSAAAPSRNGETRTAPAKGKTSEAASRKAKTAGRNGSRAASSAAHIRDVALDLFAEKSFSAVTIKEIGQATGLNTAMIYYYFEDKEDLFRDTVETAVQRAMEAFEARRSPDADPEAVISNWLETHIEQIDLIRKFVKISVDYASSDRRVPRIDEAIKRFYEGEHDILAAAMRDGSGGQFSAAEIDRMIELFSTYLDGVMVRSVIAPSFDAKAAIHSLRDYVLGLMQGRESGRQDPAIGRRA